jgi:competence protein ComEC
MQAPYVYVAILSFVAGIAWQDIFNLNTTFVVFLCMVTTVIFFGGFWRQQSAGVLTLIALVSFTLGAGRMYVSQQESLSARVLLSPYEGAHITLVGTISAEPENKETSTAVTVDVVSVEGQDITQGQVLRVLVRTLPFQGIHYGDTLEVAGVLERVQNFTSEDGGGREFNYVGYLGKDSIYYSISRATIAPALNMKATTILSRVRGYLFNIKGKYLQAISRHVPEPESALAGGITVGAKESLGEELLEAFRKTGVIHIVVLSGFNVTIIAIFLTYIFAFAGPTVGRILSAIGIVLFAILTGGGATVIRASAMGLLALLALTVRRKYAVLRALFIVGFLMALYNPKIILSDISFQLSFIATLGMILGLPIVQHHLTMITTRGGVREIVSATIATQIAVSPLILYYMGMVSVVALPANVLVLPLISVSMLAAFLTGVLGILSSALALPFAYMTYLLLHAIIYTVEALAALPFAVVHMAQFSFWWVVLSYVLLGILCYRYKALSYDLPVYVR